MTALSGFGRILSPRSTASYLGGGLMLVLGFLALGVVFITSNGLGIVLLAVPPLVVGGWVIYGGRWARAIGMTVAFAYTAVVGLVATTPLRGLTPPPGQAREPLDPMLVGLTIAFLVAGLLIALGKSRARAGPS